MVEYVITLVFSFVLLLVAFQLDEKFLCGDGRKVVSKSGILIIVGLFIFFAPIVNIIASTLVLLLTIIIVVISIYEDANVDMDEILKKIFFIKNKRGKK